MKINKPKKYRLSEPEQWVNTFFDRVYINAMHDRRNPGYDAYYKGTAFVISYDEDYQQIGVSIDHIIKPLEIMFFLDRHEALEIVKDVMSQKFNLKIEFATT